MTKHQKDSKGNIYPMSHKEYHALIRRAKTPEDMPDFKRDGSIPKRSKEYRFKLSKKLIVAVNQPGVQERKGAANARAWQDEETRMRMRAALKKGNDNPRTKKKKAQAQAKKWEDKSFREKTIASMIKANATEETKQRHAKAQARVMKDPKLNAQRKAAAKKTNAKPEVKARRSAANSASWKNPETRARRSKGISKALLRVGSISGRNLKEGFYYAFRLPDGSGIMTGITGNLRNRERQYLRGNNKHRAPAAGEFEGFDFVSECITDPWQAEQGIRQYFINRGHTVDGEVIEGASLDEIVEALRLLAPLNSTTSPHSG